MEWRQKMLSIAQIPFGSSRHVSTRHDTFDVSSASRRECRAVLLDQLDTAKMHGLDTSNVCRVVSRCDVTSQVEFRLMEFMNSKCLSCLSYGLEACKINKLSSTPCVEGKSGF